MKATFHQPPKPNKLLTVGLVAVCAMAAMGLAMAAFEGHSLALTLPMLAFTAVALVLSPMIERRRRPLEAELELAPGRVVVRDPQTGQVRAVLQSRDVVGATTARLGDHVSLALAMKPSRSAPLLFDLEDEAEADTIRRSLGIGPGGFGEAQWSTGKSRFGSFRKVMRVLWRAGVPFSAVLPLLVLACELSGWVGLVALVMRLTYGTEPPFLQLSPRGLWTYATGRDGRWHEHRIPFGAIHKVALEGDALVLECAPPFGQVTVPMKPSRELRGLDPTERDHVVAQVSAAVDRARAPSNYIERTSRLELLRRRGDTAAAWLSRLDGLGMSLRGAHDYRAATLDEADLWHTLETPELDAEVRTAAARVLSHSTEPEAHKRISAAISTERNADAQRQIRVALEPSVEVAVHAIEEIDMRRAARR